MSEKRPALTEVIAIQEKYGTRVQRISHHEGCALDVGKGACNCDPIKTSDFHAKREESDDQPADQLAVAHATLDRLHVETVPRGFGLGFLTLSERIDALVHRMQATITRTEQSRYSGMDNFASDIKGAHERLDEAGVPRHNSAGSGLQLQERIVQLGEDRARLTRELTAATVAACSSNECNIRGVCTSATPETHCRSIVMLAKLERAKPSPYRLWVEASGDHPRYIELMKQHGWIVAERKDPA